MKAYKNFVNRVGTEINDVFLTSIFGQAEPIALDTNGFYIVIKLPNDSQFIKQKVKETKSYWKPILSATMGVDEILFWEDYKEKL